MTNENENEESLAERSARLEAEAQAMYDESVDHDPLAPQPLEDNEFSNDDDSEHVQTIKTLAEQRIQELEAEIAENKDRMMRAVADAENTKRRALKESTDAKKFAVSSFSKDMLPVADNLRRALDAIPDDLKENEHVTNLIEGIEATERELLRTFEKNGLKTLNPMDEKFDPNFHEVMFETPMPDKPAGTIIQVMEVGYVLHERLIRPARVGVVKDDGQGGGQASQAEPGHNIDTEA